MLSVYIDEHELLSTPKVIAFLSPGSGGINNRLESNPIPYPGSEYCSGLVCLANLTAPKKQSSRVKSMFKYRDHASISQTINKFTTFFGKKALPCFKQLSLNLYLILESIPLFQKDNNLL